MNFYKKTIQFLCCCLLTAFSLQSSLANQVYPYCPDLDDPLSVRQAIKQYPKVDGKCTYLLALTDTEGNGWDGASVDVSVSEAWPAANHKMAPYDGYCKVIPIYVGHGETIDLTYWNGAFEEQHGLALFTASGEIAYSSGNFSGGGTSTEAIDFAPGSIFTGYPMRIKGDCPASICAESTLDVAIDFVSISNPTEPLFFEIQTGSGEVVYSVGPALADELAEEVVTLDKCNTYTLVFGNTSGGSGWDGTAITLTADEAVYNNYGPDASGNYHLLYNAYPNPTSGMQMLDFTIPCEPEAPETLELYASDCDDYASFSVPLVEPEVCYETCHLDCTSPAVSAEVYLDGSYIGNYTYNYPTGISGSIYSQASPGKHNLKYVFKYNCESINELGQPITVSTTSKVNVGTVYNPTLTCNWLVNISLTEDHYSYYGGGAGTAFESSEDAYHYYYGYDCSVEITPDMVLENVQGCEQEYWVNIAETGGNLIDPSMAGTTVEYEVIHILSGNTCWGKINIEDKTKPTIHCYDYDINCTHPEALNEEYCADSEACAINQVITKENIYVSSPLAPLECTPYGEIIKELTFDVSVDHTRPEDLRIYLNVPYYGQIYLGRMNAAGEKTFSSLAEASWNGSNLSYLHYYDYNILEDGLEIVLLDTENAAGPSGVGTGYGKLEAACLTVKHGFPTPYYAHDCSGVEVSLLNEMVSETDCNQSNWVGAQIMRIYQAEDTWGNISTCTQTVNLKAPTLDQLEIPADVELECEGLAPEEITPELAGGIKFGCFELTEDLHSLCDISFTYEDRLIPACGEGFKIERTWFITNWCSSTTKEYTQLIKVEDSEGPTIAQEDITVGTNAYTCDADLTIADLGIEDNCSGVSSVLASYSGTVVDLTNGGSLEGLPLGETLVTIIAKDGCLNPTEKLITITVVDDTPPIAICDDELHVSLGGDGEAWLHAEDIDEGSYDNCGDVTLEVRRIGGCLGDSPWADSVPFECCDINETVTVELRVTDAAGNSNICWKTALIEDTLPPVITCAADKTINCDDPAVHNPFGEAAAIDNCTVEVSSVDGGELDQCFAGVLTRTFTATDGSAKSVDATCTQSITVVHVSDFVVQFPADVTLTDCALQDTGEPTITDDDCEMVAISSDDLILEVVSDACYKIERTWIVTNWCIYDRDAANTDLGFPLPVPRTYRDDGDGYFKYVQTIKVLDTNAPVITCQEDQVFCDYDGCEGEATLTVSATDECSDEIGYTYKIDAFNDGTFDITGSGNDASGEYPYGTHLIKWIAEDGCGNTAECSYLFTIEDCKNPTPVCINGLSLPGMNSDGCAEIWANDFLEYAFDNCTDTTFVEQSVKIRRDGDAGALQDNLILCCEDLGTVIVEIWVSDDADGNGIPYTAGDNTDFCSTYIILQDNTGICGGGGAGSVAGTIQTETGEDVEHVMVEISGNVSNAIPTGATGSFVFPNLAMNNDYVVTPSKDMNPVNGVTTFDLVLMTQHILGTNELDSPYQMIAADINNDGKITTFDVIEGRRLILYVIQDFPANTSWRFIDANYEFPNPFNPWAEAFPEVIDINSLSQDELAANFTAVKVGDVNGNAIPNSLLGSEERNTVGDLVFSIDDTEMKAGEVYTVDFLAKDFNQVAGYQFSLNFDNSSVEFAGIEAGELNVTDANFGLSLLDEGVITTSFNTTNGVTAKDDAVLFSINFTATSNGMLSETIKMSSRYTRAEAYNSELELMDVAIEFNTTEGSVFAGANFELYQNTPNPFNNTTEIGFNLPEAASATLRVYDVAGRTLKVVEGDFAKGFNQITLNAADLKGAGVMYYRLDTPNNTATMKMMIIE